MYAYIRFVEDGVTDVVHIDVIQKYDVNKTYKPYKTFNILYKNDGQYYRGYIISTGETREEAEKLGTPKRFRIPNKQYNNATTSESTSDELAIQQEEFPKTKKKGPLDAALENNYKSLLGNIDVQDNITTITNPDNNDTLHLKNEMKVLMNKVHRLTDCVNELKDLVISKFQELEQLLENRLHDFPDEKENDENLVVGSRRGDKVHVGRNIFLSTTTFDNIWRKRKHTIFIKEMAVAIFGERTLQNSSLCGGPSNRNREPSRPALDPTKLLAIQDLLKLRLSESGVMKNEEQQIIKNMDKIINEKIQDLRRLRNKKEKFPNVTSVNIIEVNNNEDRNAEVLHDLIVVNDKLLPLYEGDETVDTD